MGSVESSFLLFCRPSDPSSRSEMMKAILALVVCLLVAVYAEQALEVHVEYLPQNCEIKSKKGDTIYWHYTGTLLDGTQFDSSVGRNPYFAKLGAGQVIEGVDRAMLDMCVGEKRKMVIPSDLAYGPGGYGTVIPPGATLKFEVELMRIDPAPAEINYFKLIDVDRNNFLSNQEVMGFSPSIQWLHL